MTNAGLPPGCTHRDVDGRMADGDTAAVAGDVTVHVTTEVDPHATSEELEAQLVEELGLDDHDVLHVEVAEVER